MELVIATKNKHKQHEIQAMFSGTQITVVGLDRYPSIPETIEDGDTFEANALKKAREVFAVTKTWTLADDSGLQVDVLNGAPGIYSARYAGEGATYDMLCKKVLAALQNVPDGKRTARFNCTMALIEPSGKEHLVVGTCEGHIGHTMQGSHGFGYDPVFIYEGTGKTLAEMSPHEKNGISHRARAVEKIKGLLRTLV